MICFSCGKQTGLSSNVHVGYREACLHCSADLHSCRQCRFFDRRAYNECKEPSAERVLEKEKANHCDFFSAAELPLESQGVSVTDHRARAEALFKKKG